jgi:hypothetical protein
LLYQFDRVANRANKQLPLKRTAEGNFNILEVARLKAAFDTAEYYERRLLTARAIDGALELLTRACSLAKPDGLWLEFGVASGTTIRHIAGLHLGKVYGFDSFEGLPEDWRSGYEKGVFAGKNPNVPANVELIRGWFADSLGTFLSTHSEAVSFLHVDCDLYSSTKTVFELLESRLEAGSVIVFDEYWNYPGWKQHEHKAFCEFIEKTRLPYIYDSFVPFTQQVCIVLG